MSVESKMGRSGRFEDKDQGAGGGGDKPSRLIVIIPPGGESVEELQRQVDELEAAIKDVEELDARAQRLKAKMLDDLGLGEN